MDSQGLIQPSNPLAVKSLKRVLWIDIDILKYRIFYSCSLRLVRLSTGTLRVVKKAKTFRRLREEERAEKQGIIGKKTTGEEMQSGRYGEETRSTR